MEPLIFQKTLTLPLPSDDDRRAHDQRLRDAFGLGPLYIPLSLLRSTAAIINAKRELSCIIGRTGDQYRLIDIDRRRSYSVALDLGTTNLVAVLYDNIGQKDIVTRSLENPQVEYGGDILTRMHHAMTGNGEDIYRVLRNGVNTLIASLCREDGVNGRDLHGLAAAGNTVMTHFLLGLDISTIPVAPWVPVVRTPGFFSAAELGLDLNPEALAYVFPNAGSYVGGDITAGIIATGMHTTDRPSILVDMGTNAEVVIGNREWMIVGAGAAGPALEEGISAIGKRAKKGIVYDVEISGDCVTCRTCRPGPSRRHLRLRYGEPFVRALCRGDHRPDRCVHRPDTPANQAGFPQSATQKPGLGFPLARLVAIISLSSGAVLEWKTSPCEGKRTGETAMLWQLAHRLKAGDVVIADRYFSGYFLLAWLVRHGVDVVVRQHQLRHTDFRRGKRLGVKDHVVAWRRPQRPVWMDAATYAAMPETLMLREACVGGLTLVTTLAAADEVSKRELLFAALSV